MIFKNLPFSLFNKIFSGEKRLVFVGAGVDTAIEAEETQAKVQESISKAEQDLPHWKSEAKEARDNAEARINRLPRELQTDAREEINRYLGAIDIQISSVEKEMTEAKEAVSGNLSEEVTNFNIQINETAAATRRGTTGNVEDAVTEATTRRARALREGIVAPGSAASILKEVYEMQNAVAAAETMLETEDNDQVSNMEKAEMMTRMAEALSIRLNNIDLSSGPHAMVGQRDTNRLKTILRADVNLDNLPDRGALSWNNIQKFYNNLRTMRDNPNDSLVVNNEDGIIFLRHDKDSTPKAYPLYQASNSISQAPRFDISEDMIGLSGAALNQNTKLKISSGSDIDITIRLDDTNGKIAEFTDNRTTDTTRKLGELLSKDNKEAGGMDIAEFIAYLQRAKAESIQRNLNPERIQMDSEAIDTLWEFGIGVRDRGLGTFNMPNRRVLMLNNNGNTESISAQTITVGNEDYLKILVYQKGGTHMDVVTFKKPKKSHRGEFVSLYQNIPKTTTFQDYHILQESINNLRSQEGITRIAQNENEARGARPTAEREGVYTANNASEDLGNLSDAFGGNGFNLGRLSTFSLTGYEAAVAGATTSLNDTRTSSRITIDSNDLTLATKRSRRSAIPAELLALDNDMTAASDAAARLLIQGRIDALNTENNTLDSDIALLVSSNNDAEEEIDRAQARLETVQARRDAASQIAGEIERIPGTDESITKVELNAIKAFLTSVNGSAPTNPQLAEFRREHLTIEDYHITAFRNVDSYSTAGAPHEEDFNDMVGKLHFLSESGSFGEKLKEANSHEKALIRRFILENINIDIDDIEPKAESGVLTSIEISNTSITDLSALLQLPNSVTIVIENSASITQREIIEAETVYGNAINRIQIEGSDASFNDPNIWNGKSAERAYIMKNNLAGLRTSENKIEFTANSITIKDNTAGWDLTGAESFSNITIEDLSGQNVKLPENDHLRINAAGDAFPSVADINTLLRGNLTANIDEFKIKCQAPDDDLVDMLTTANINNLELNIEDSAAYSNDWKTMLTDICNNSDTKIKYLKVTTAWSQATQDTCFEGITRSGIIIQVNDKILDVRIPANSNEITDDLNTTSRVYVDMLASIQNWSSNITIHQVTNSTNLLRIRRPNQPDHVSSTYGIQISKTDDGEWVATLVKLDNATPPVATPLSTASFEGRFASREFRLPQAGGADTPIDQLSELTQNINSLANYELRGETLRTEITPFLIRDDVSSVEGVDVTFEENLVTINASNAIDQNGFNQIINSIGRQMDDRQSGIQINLNLNTENWSDDQFAEITNLNFNVSGGSFEIGNQITLIERAFENNLKITNITLAGDLDADGKTNFPNLFQTNIPTSTTELNGISGLPKNISDDEVEKNLEKIVISGGSGAIPNFNKLKNLAKLTTLEITGRTISAADLLACSKLTNLKLHDCTIAPPNTNIDLKHSFESINTIDFQGTSFGTGQLTIPSTVTSIENLDDVQNLKITEHNSLSTLLDNIDKSEITSLDLTGSSCAGLDANFLEEFPILATLTISNIREVPEYLVIPADITRVGGNPAGEPALTSIDLRGDFGAINTLTSNSVFNKVEKIKFGNAVEINENFNRAFFEHFDSLTNIDLSNANVSITTLEIPKKVINLNLPNTITRINARGHENAGALLQGIVYKDAILEIDFSMHGTGDTAAVTRYEDIAEPEGGGETPTYNELFNQFPNLRTIIIAGTTQETLPDSERLGEAFNKLEEDTRIQNLIDEHLGNYRTELEQLPAIINTGALDNQVANINSRKTQLNTAIGHAQEYIQALRDRYRDDDNNMPARIEEEIDRVQALIDGHQEALDADHERLQTLSIQQANDIIGNLDETIREEVEAATGTIGSLENQVEEKTVGNISLEDLNDLDPNALLEMLVRSGSENMMTELDTIINNEISRIEAIRDDVDLELTDAQKESLNDNIDRIRALSNDRGTIKAAIDNLASLRGNLEPLAELQGIVEQHGGEINSNALTTDPNARKLIESLEINTVNNPANDQIRGLTLAPDGFRELDLSAFTAASSLTLNLSSLGNFADTNKNIRIVCSPSIQSLDITGDIGDLEITGLDMGNTGSLNLSNLESENITLKGESVNLDALQSGEIERTSVNIEAATILPDDYNTRTIPIPPLFSPDLIAGNPLILEENTGALNINGTPYTVNNDGYLVP